LSYEAQIAFAGQRQNRSLGKRQKPRRTKFRVSPIV
jgi:hypothetical protein